MPDIFISYSRKDSTKALAFAERLRVAGYDIWMDQTGIEGATSWTKEIVGAIKDCGAFCLLLSSTSLVSQNVIKEVSLASQFKRPIVPIELEKVQVTDDFHYQLAGLQRMKIENLDGILRSLMRLGMVGKAGTMIAEGEKPDTASFIPHASSFIPHPSSLPTDSRKSLMILPFEDLSPGKDNDWFADGLTSELIGALSRIKSLRLIDQKTSREFKHAKIKTMDIARELDVRYFIEGSVRKFGDQIKIALQLLDIEKEEYLWQDSHKGVFADIFEIQEAVAKKVVDGLTLTLTSDEKKKIRYTGTDNPEAYELFLKAQEFERGGSKERIEHALAMQTTAIELDPQFANAYNHKAICLGLIYRSFDRDAKLLDEAESLVRKARELNPSLTIVHLTLSRLRLFRDDLEGAVKYAKEYVRQEPNSPESYNALGFIYAESLQFEQAIAPFEACVRLNKTGIVAYFNLCYCCEKAGELEKLTAWSNEALTRYEPHLRLWPDDERAKIDYAVLLRYTGQQERAVEYLRSLTGIRDGMTVFNVGCLWAELEDYDAALQSLRKSFEMGFQRYDLFRMFDPPISEMPEYHQLLRDIEAKEAKNLTTPLINTDRERNA